MPSPLSVERRFSSLISASLHPLSQTLFQKLPHTLQSGCALHCAIASCCVASRLVRGDNCPPEHAQWCSHHQKRSGAHCPPKVMVRETQLMQQLSVATPCHLQMVSKPLVTLIWATNIRQLMRKTPHLRGALQAGQHLK